MNLRSITEPCITAIERDTIEEVLEKGTCLVKKDRGVCDEGKHNK